jgi:hypothetical protein
MWCVASRSPPITLGLFFAKPVAEVRLPGRARIGVWEGRAQIGVLAVQAARRRGDRGAVIEEIETGWTVFQLCLSMAFDGGLVKAFDVGYGALWIGMKGVSEL